MTNQRDVLRVGDQDALDTAVEEFFRTELANARSSSGRRFGEKFVLAALESLPWVGVFVAAVAATRDADAGARVDRLQTLWLEQFSEKFRRLREVLAEMGARFEALGGEVRDRVESEEYLQIVRKAFRAWDRAETEEKQRYLANLLMNAGAGATVTSDDIVRLFIEWIDTYNEAHFSVIKQVYDHSSGITRRAICSGSAGPSHARTLPRPSSSGCSYTISAPAVSSDSIETPGRMGRFWRSLVRLAWRHSRALAARSKPLSRTKNRTYSRPWGAISSTTL